MTGINLCNVDLQLFHAALNIYLKTRTYRIYVLKEEKELWSQKDFPLLESNHTTLYSTDNEVFKKYEYIQLRNKINLRTHTWRPKHCNHDFN